MARSPHPYVAWRGGRPRFVPSPQLRAAGHKGRDLRHPDGSWYSRGEAVDWSDAFCRKLAEQAPRPAPQAATAARPSAAPAGAKPRSGDSVRTCQIEKPATVLTVAQLFEDWFRSHKFQLPADPAEARRAVAGKLAYAPATVRGYRHSASVLEKFDAELWWAPAEALTRPVVYGLYEKLLAARGVSVARRVVATLSAALKWAHRRGRVTFRLNGGVNPAHDLGMVTPPARIRVGTRREVETLIAVADHVGRLDMGDAIMLGLWTGQRQGDRLALEDRGLVKGRRVFRQSKTGAIVAVRQVPELARRLAASAERRRAARAQALLKASTAEEREAVEARFARVILNEHVDERFGTCAWRPFGGFAYTHLFAEIRAICVRGIVRGERLPVPTGSGARRSKKRAADLPAPAGEDWLIAPCPSLADFHDQDLRDTAVTWMARGGATIPQICAVTGHSLQSATRILRHYLAIEPELGDVAIERMLAWYEEEEEAL